MRSSKPVVLPLQPTERWEGQDIRRFTVDGRPAWLFQDLWRALGFHRDHARRVIEPLHLDRHKWHVSVDDEPSPMTVLDAHGLERLLAAAPIPEQAASLRRVLLGRPARAADERLGRAPIAPPTSPEPSAAAVQGVDARELHAALGIGRDFSNWIKDQIERLNLEQGRDFEVSAINGENLQGGRPRTEYVLSRPAAKLISVTSEGRDPKVRSARSAATKHLIALEDGHAPQAAVTVAIQALTRTVEQLHAVILPLASRVEKLERGALPSTLPGEAVERGDVVVLRRPPRDGYRNVTEVLRRLQIPVHGPRRHVLGRRVAEAFRLEAPSHPDWPREPILLARLGNWYPAQTWSWLDRTVARVAELMGYHVRRLMPEPPAASGQSALFREGRP
jgi:phage anti-repressor protein